MLDEGICLVCGDPVSSDSVYCSRNCSVVDSSSSSHSAPSSGHPSPQVYPADKPSVVVADSVPGLVYSHHRARPSLSSTSTVDSEEYVYGNNRSNDNINFKRRPGTTNSRGVIPTLHNRQSSTSTSHRRLSSNTADHSFMRFKAEEELSSFAKAKAWKETFALTAPSPLPSPSILDSTSSDEDDLIPDAFAFDAPQSPHHQETLKTRSSHRVSLPAYFSRLSIDPSNARRSPTTERSTPIDQLAQSLPSSKSNKSSPRSRSAFGASSTSTVTNAFNGGFRGFTPTAVHPPTSLSHVETAFHTSTTPRGRGRERRARVRRGASRSPPRSISSLDMSPSPSRSSSPIPAEVDNEHSRGRGRDRVPRALMTTAANTTNNVKVPITNVPLCGSLGGRILREAQQAASSQQQTRTSPSGGQRSEEEVRGRRGRGEDVGNDGEERERGRSRLVVKRRGSEVAAPS